MQISVTHSFRSSRRQSGFTLIELLVVVAVLVLLLAILSPSLRMVKIMARRLMCRTRLAGIAESSIAYASSNRGVYIKARFKEVQLCLNPRHAGQGGDHETDWVDEAARVGLEGVILTCPDRPDFPQWESSYNQLVIGYQYFGGIEVWRNPSGTFASRSPVSVTSAGPRWVMAADAMMKIDRVWGGGRPTAYGDMPPHRDGAPWPAGGNQAYADGSTDWVDFADTIFIHSWAPGSRAGYFLQDDLGDYKPPTEAYGRYEMD